MITESVSARPYENSRFNKNKFSRGPKVNFSSAPKDEKIVIDKEPEDKSSRFSFKTATNVLGVAAWIGIVGYSILDLKMFRKKNPETTIRRLKNFSKKALLKSEETADPNAKENISKALNGSKLKKGIYKTGSWFQNQSIKWGGELFNNFTYAFGTLVVMPLVVLFSPFGKKNSSKDDKFFAVMRQPLSVVATLSLQYTFDRMMEKYLPRVMKSNVMEDSSILHKEGKDKGKIKYLDENGKFISENYKKIKYNSDGVKDVFKNLFEVDRDKDGLKGLLNKEEIDSIFTRASYESDSSGTYATKLKNVLKEKFKGLNIEKLDDILNETESFKSFKNTNANEAKAVKDITENFRQVAKVFDSNKLSMQKSKIGLNVIAASVIGCTFLNVIYGKFMKSKFVKSLVKSKNETIPPQPSVDNTQKKTEKEVK